MQLYTILKNNHIFVLYSFIAIACQVISKKVFKSTSNTTILFSRHNSSAKSYYNHIKKTPLFLLVIILASFGTVEDSQFIYFFSFFFNIFSKFPSCKAASMHAKGIRYCSFFRLVAITVYLRFHLSNVIWKLCEAPMTASTFPFAVQLKSDHCVVYCQPVFSTASFCSFTMKGTNVHVL